MPRSASLTVSVSEPSDTHLSSITSALPDTQQSNSRAGTVGRRRESLNADTFKPSRLSVIPYSPFSRNRSKSPFFAQKNSSTATVDAPGAKDRFDESAQSPISSLASLNVYGPGTDSASLLSGRYLGVFGWKMTRSNFAQRMIVEIPASPKQTRTSNHGLLVVSCEWTRHTPARIKATTAFKS